MITTTLKTIHLTQVDIENIIKEKLLKEPCVSVFVVFHDGSSKTFADVGARIEITVDRKETEAVPAF
jgi:hypothetical protein